MKSCMNPIYVIELGCDRMQTTQTITTGSGGGGIQRSFLKS